MITTDHEALVKCSPDETIWRYMDLPKFESFLINRALFLCRSDKFADPFEGSVPKAVAEYRITEEKRIAQFFKRQISDQKAAEKSKNIADLHKRFKRAFVVNCWQINPHESDAMWKLYLKTNEGLAIQSTYSKLYDSLAHNTEEIFISKVRYIDYEKDGWYDANDYRVKGYNLFSPIVHKRKEFKQENELRVFQQIDDAVNDENYWEKQPIRIGKLISCIPQQLIERIIIPPTADDAVKEAVEQILSQQGLKVNVIRSTLSGTPIY